MVVRARDARVSLPPGWSAPAAIGIGGLGGGFNAGADMVDMLIVLNSSAAVRSFMSSGSLQLGGNLSLSVGPLGRSGEASAAMNSDMEMSAMYSYSMSRGLYGGITIEGTVLVDRSDNNKKTYGRSVSAKEVLAGRVDVPAFAEPLVARIAEITGGDHSAVSRRADADDVSEEAVSLRSSRVDANYVELVVNERAARSKPRPSRGQSASEELSGRLRSAHLNDHGLRTESATSVADPFADQSALLSDDEGRSSVGAGSVRGAGSGSRGAEPARGASSPWSHSEFDLPSQGSDDLSHAPLATKAGAARWGRAPAADAVPQDKQIAVASATSHFSSLNDDLVMALHDFDAQQSGDLPFQKGDIIRVLHRTASDEDWWRGEIVDELGDTRQGLCVLRYGEC